MQFNNDFWNACRLGPDAPCLAQLEVMLRNEERWAWLAEKRERDAVFGGGQ